MLLKKQFITLIIAIGMILSMSLDGLHLTGSIHYSYAVEKVPLSFASLAKELNPAVVNINTTQLIEGFGGFPSPFREGDPFEEFFKRFFGDIFPPEYKQRSLGSGFIISRDGYIVTNNHVVENAQEIKITLMDGKRFDGKIIGRDSKTDLALIKINPKEDLPAAKFGDSEKLEVGDWVMAIGNPFGLGHTVTAGIVSAKGRIIGAGPYDDFIQTDASINPGNSGGPLFNLSGEVVGVNTAILGGAQGIGFATPINLAKEVISQLKEKGGVIRGWIGVSAQRLTPEIARSFNLKETNGALISEVAPQGPADRAGLMRGDIILEFDGKEVKQVEDLPRIVAATPVGKTVKVKVLRDGEIKTFSIAIERSPEEGRPVMRRRRT